MEHPVDADIERKGIIVSSDVPISVIVAQIDLYYSQILTNDATMIPPVCSGYTSFLIANHKEIQSECISALRNEFFTIASSENNP